jgi:hypothetical protein
MGNQRRYFFMCCSRRTNGRGWFRPPGRFSQRPLSTALQYLSLQFPVEHSWTNYNSLQQLAYFFTVFVAATLAVVTGLMQSPAIANQLGWFARILNRQAARTIHFGVLYWFLFFIFIHVTLVFITGARQNLNYMWAGVNDNSWDGLLIWGCAMVLVIVTWWLASPFQDQACPAGSEDRPNGDPPPYGHRGMGKPEDTVHSTRDLVVLLAQWHAAKLR